MISTLGLRSSLDLLLWDRRQDMCELHRRSEKSRNLLVLLLGRASSEEQQRPTGALTEPEDASSGPAAEPHRPTDCAGPSASPAEPPGSFCSSPGVKKT